jgi:DNA-binding response OmpR family regulator
VGLQKNQRHSNIRVSEPGGSEMAKRLLIVDDEPQIRSLLQRLFSKRGFETIEFPDGQTALLAVRELSGNIAALITDIEMQGMSGIELAKTARSEFPRVPILFLSSAATTECELNQRVAGCVFVQKPFDPAMLLLTLESLMEAR